MFQLYLENKEIDIDFRLEAKAQKNPSKKSNKSLEHNNELIARTTSKVK